MAQLLRITIEKLIHGGAGLGLALVKHIAEAHGARLTIESVVSQGTTVRLEFLPKDEE